MRVSAHIQNPVHRRFLITSSPSYRIEPLPGYTLTIGRLVGMLCRGKPLEHYVHELGEVRRRTLEGLAARDDVWLERTLIAPHVSDAPHTAIIDVV
jgi:hypothetical protein